MAAKTVKEHLNETSEIKKHLDDSDALIVKMKGQLSVTREALEWSLKFHNQNFEAGGLRYVHFNPHGSGATKETATLKEVVDHQIKQINALLGDRA